MADLSRCLVLGAGGMVGRGIPFGIKLGRADLDITDPVSIRQECERYQPSAIISLASFDIRRCEIQPFEAIQTNVIGMSHLAHVASERNIPIVMVSSGSVFSGSADQVFDEASIPSPLQLYGQSKWIAEMLLTSIAPRSLVVRTGWLFGGQPAHNINYMDRMLAAAMKNEPLMAGTDQRGTPTYLADFVDSISDLLRGDATGVFHVVNEGSATGFDIAQEIVRLTGSKSSIQRLASRDVVNAVPVRSVSEALTSKKIHMRPWRDALRAYLQKKAPR